MSQTVLTITLLHIITPMRLSSLFLLFIYKGRSNRVLLYRYNLKCKNLIQIDLTSVVWHIHIFAKPVSAVKKSIKRSLYIVSGCYSLKKNAFENDLSWKPTMLLVSSLFYGP